MHLCTEAKLVNYKFCRRTRASNNLVEFPPTQLALARKVVRAVINMPKSHISPRRKLPKKIFNKDAFSHKNVKISGLFQHNSACRAV